jgi:opacity protein-like surface antigen
LQSGGTHDQYELSANLFYDLPVAGVLVPYVGGGFGLSSVHNATAYFAEPGAPSFRSGGASAVYATMNAVAGATVALNSHWAVVPSFRFEHMFVDGDRWADNAALFRVGLRYPF